MIRVKLKEFWIDKYQLKMVTRLEPGFTSFTSVKGDLKFKF